MSDVSNMTAKAVLRKQIISILKNIGEQEKARQSRIILHKVLANEKFKAARTISIYLNMEDEVQTEQILVQIFKLGKECYIPRFQFGNPEMEMVKLATIEDYNNLPKNKWNIKQPSDEQVLESVFEKGELDLVLTPGLAFTRFGERLGRGKGYYDKFFQKCKSDLKRFPYLIGLGFNEQIIKEIPTAEHDIRLDLVLNAEE